MADASRFPQGVVIEGSLAIARPAGTIIRSTGDGQLYASTNAVVPTYTALGASSSGGGPFALAVNPPLVAAFGAPINPGTSTISQGAGGALVIEAEPASGLQARLFPLTGLYVGAKRLRICLTSVIMDVGAGDAGFGVFLRRSANGRFVTLQTRGDELSWVRWTDPTLYALTWSATSYKGEPWWIEIADDGVNNLTGNYSTEGSYWSTSSTIPNSVVPETYAAFLGDKPDQMGIIGFADNGFGIKALAACHDLAVT
jgi:hypothetical protein